MNKPEIATQHGTTWSRRDWLKMAALGAAALALPGRSSGAPAAGRIPIALQLYSIRKECGQNFDQALEAAAKMGLDGVEFAGYYKYGQDAAGLRKRLDDLGLKAAATHIGLGTMTGDNLKRTIDFHKTIGCKFLIVPGDGAFANPERSKGLAETFNQVAAALKPEGLYCGYHNHTGEFAQHEGKTYWDLFAERTAPEVVLQQDVGWSTNAGQDPVALIRRYPGRTKSTHFKPEVKQGEAGKEPIIGKDSVNWKGIITACYEVGGTEWFTVEQEWYPQGVAPIEASQRSVLGLKAILKDMGK